MSKVLVIPDVHLKPEMFDCAEKILENGQADFAVQLGDLVDDWEMQCAVAFYQKTIERVIEFNKKFPNTLWCMGNHDYGYYDTYYGRQETGHSRLMEDEMARLLKKMFNEGGVHQKIVHIVDNVIFSHAGVTFDFVKERVPDISKWENDVNFVINLLNDLSGKDLWDPYSPIWARPQDGHSVMWGKQKYMQVVGHTPVRTAEYNKYTKILSTDTFSTYSDGTEFGDRRFVIVDTVNKTWEYVKEEKWYH